MESGIFLLQNRNVSIINLLLFSGMDGVLGAAATGPGGLGARFFLLPAEEFRLLSKPMEKKFAVAIRYSALSYKLLATIFYDSYLFSWMRTTILLQRAFYYNTFS